jgi:hypothetical protein
MSPESLLIRFVEISDELKYFFSSIMDKQTSDWVSESNACTNLSLRCSTGQVDFKPELTYQIFDDQQIFGYKNLRIAVMHASGFLRIILG